MIKNILKKYIVEVVFLGEWIVYLLAELFLGRINTTKQFLYNLLPLLFFFFLAKIFKYFHKKIDVIKNKYFYLMIGGLFICDQFIKYLFRNIKFLKKINYIVPDYFYFKPILNTSGSWITSRFNLPSSFLLLSIINFIFIILVYEGYKFYIYKKKNTYWLQQGIIFFIAGGFASLVDKMFFGGSLDYIGIKGLFVADLKDIFIDIGLALLIIEFVKFKNIKLNTTLKEDWDLLKRFFKFIWLDFKTNILNQKES